ncbi:MAG: MmpS family transport accessory protein [Egibacteraceae bacterium]
MNPTRGPSPLHLLVFTVFVSLAAGCGVPPGLNSGPHTIVYEVIGAEKAGNITYAAGGGGIAQDNGVVLPWRKELQVDGPLSLAQVSAQNAGGGTITCRITVDGKVVKELSSQGEYAVVSCASGPL